MSEAPVNMEELNQPSTKETLAGEVRDKMGQLINPTLDYAGYDDKTGNRLIIILGDKPTDPNNPQARTEHLMEIYVGNRSELNQLTLTRPGKLDQATRDSIVFFSTELKLTS